MYRPPLEFKRTGSSAASAKPKSEKKSKVKDPTQKIIADLKADKRPHLDLYLARS